MKQKSAGQEEEMFANAIRKAGTDGKLAAIHLKTPPSLLTNPWMLPFLELQVFDKH